MKKKWFAPLVLLGMLLAVPVSAAPQRFAKHSIGAGFFGAMSVRAIDVDGDGDLDVVGAADVADDIRWWENVGGNPPSFVEHIIDGDFDAARDAYPCDLDLDGDVDVVGAAIDANDIAWWENDGSENFTKHMIKDDFGGAVSVSAADLDLDGDVDVLGTAAYDNKVSWWESYTGRRFEQHTIDGNFDAARDAYPCDLDLDGDVDVLGVAIDANEIAWWENDGSENFTKHVIKDDFGGAVSVSAADLDLDGDVDVLGTAAYDNEVSWWENVGGAPPAFVEHTIDGEATWARSAYAADVDADGDLDLIGSVARDNEIAWWQNDGSQNFTRHTIQQDFTNPTAVYVVDLDLDGDVDVVAGAVYADKIAWWENDGNGNFAGHIIREHYSGSYSVYAADVDGDGDVDILSTALSGYVTWWENDGSQNFAEHTIRNDFPWSSPICAADLDQDGDTDVFGASYSTGEVVWWENAGGAPPSFIEHPMGDGFLGAMSLRASDVDGDGDLDVVGAADVADDITWWENDVGHGFTEHTIDGEATWARSAYAADVDADGDLDLIGSVAHDNEIAWWENDGHQNFTRHTIQQDFTNPTAVYVVDLDLDGDVDVVAAAHYADKIAWWENDGNGNFAGHTIREHYSGPYCVYAADVDGDGDVDILATQLGGYVTWWENDGSQNFTERALTEDFVKADQVYAADLDADGDMDLLGAAYFTGEVAWWENVTLVDSTPPTTVVSAEGSVGASGWFLSPVTVALSATDDPGGSGVAYTEYSLDGGANWAIYTGPISIAQEGLHTILARSADNAGNLQDPPAMANVGIDLTAPATTATPDGTVGSDGWFVSPVAVNLNASDGSAGSGLAYTEYSLDGGATWYMYSGPFAISQEGITTVLMRSGDNAGNIQDLPVSQEVRIDLTPPTIVGSNSPSPNMQGWNSEDVTVHFDCADSVSGLDFCPPDSILSDEGAGQAVTGTAVDLAGNTATVTVGDINIDKTPPTISGARWPVPNEYGWNNTDVTVHFDCADTTSGVASCPDDTLLSDEGVGQSVTGTAADLAGNTATVTVGNINIDKTPPTISGSRWPAPNENGWNNTDVTVHFECSDATSGVASCSDDTVLSDEGAGQSVTGTAEDFAGNTATATVADINIDKTPPAAAIVELTPNPASLTALVSLKATVSDTLSGVQAAEWCAEAESAACVWATMSLTGAPGGGSLTASAGISGLGPGVYSIKVKGQDQAGNWGEPAQAFLVVYNPDAGFVTGGGWVIPSTSSGDWLPGINGRDKANFGFVAKYKKGASVPEGQLEFHYRPGDFKLHSTEIQWLVLSGNRATFQGLATINLHPDHTFVFRVDAWDGQLNGGSLQDTFVLKAWYNFQDPNTDPPVYRASGSVSGGNIIIHAR